MPGNTIDLVLRTKKTGTGGQEAEKELTGLQKAAKMAGAAVAAGVVIQGAKAAYELAELGAQSLRTKRAFEAISGGALIAAGNLDAMRRATRGAMSEQAMMASANQLMQMGLANNAAELEQVATMATRLGSAMGKEAGPAVEEFALMLANQSIPRLDTFGISASKVRARILELQAATPGLSREMAFMTATMEEGETAMARLGDAVDDELLANERLEASWADLKVMAGEALAPAMADVAEAAAKITRALIEQQTEIMKLTSLFGEADVHQASFNERMGFGSEAMDALKRQAEAFREQVEAGMSPMAIYTAGVSGIGGAADIAAGSLGGLATKAKTVAGAFGEMVFDDEQLWKMAAASGASLKELEDLAGILGIASDAEIEATKQAYALVEGFGAGTVSAEELTGGFSSLETASMLAAGKFEGLGSDTSALTDMLGGAAREADGVTDALKRIPTNIDVSINVRTAGGPGGAGGFAEGLQSGTAFWHGGLAIVGEAGPELVALPRGMRVWPANAPETRAAISNRYNYGGDTIYINDRLASALYLESRRRERIRRIERM